MQFAKRNRRPYSGGTWTWGRRHGSLNAACFAAIIATVTACSGSSTSGVQASSAPTNNGPTQSGSSASGSTEGGNGAQYQGNLTFWFWGESDVPGSTKWMQDAVERYKKLHTGINIEFVPQATQTLQGAFQTAAQAKSGPDIAMQWATLPVLTPVWNGSVAPLTGLIPQDEMDNWLNTSENTYDGKVWAMPLYLMGIPFVWNKDIFTKAGLNPEKAPATWDELLADCAKIKAAGITPIAVGDTDGAFGSWMMSVVGTQNLDSIQELQAPYAGTADFTDPKYSAYLDKIAELKDKGYLSDDVSSIDATQAWQDFAQEKAAMTWTTDGNVAAWAKTSFGQKVGVAKTPNAGNGKLAEYYNATQSISAFITSWSENKEAAAAFLSWLHEPENLNSWYSTLGSFPADKRFSASAITNPLMKQLFKFDTLPNQLWAENYAPPQVDDQGLRKVSQGMLAGTTTAKDAATQIAQVIKDWQTQHPDEFQTYKKWAQSN